MLPLLSGLGTFPSRSSRVFEGFGRSPPPGNLPEGGELADLVEPQLDGQLEGATDTELASCCLGACSVVAQVELELLAVVVRPEGAGWNPIVGLGGGHLFSLVSRCAFERLP